MKKGLLFVILITGMQAKAQLRVSILNDLSVLRTFHHTQSFWSLGHSIAGNFHFSPARSGYISFTYYTPGNFKNVFTAVARSGSTIPQTMDFTVKGSWALRQLAFGGKQYLTGAFNAESAVGIYGQAGLGIMWVKASNTFTPEVDTALYTIPAPLESGEGSFFGITADLALGVEKPLGGNFFAYAEGRTWGPLTKNKTPYIHKNDKVLFPVMLHLGLRILFGY